jgi:ferredoxin
MAQLSDRNPHNVPGRWYNDDTCTDCGLCSDLAPGIFRRHDGSAQNIVWHQPETPEELTLAREAQQACPTDSIGSDGAILTLSHKSPPE